MYERRVMDMDLGTLIGMLVDCSSSNRVSPTLPVCSTVTANTRSHLRSTERVIVSLTELLADCTLNQSQFPSPTRTSHLVTQRSLSQGFIPLAPRCGWHPQESIHPKGTGSHSSPEAKSPATLSVLGYYATPEHPEDLSPIYGSFLLT